MTNRARNPLLGLVLAALLALLVWPVWHLYRDAIVGDETIEREDPAP